MLRAIKPPASSSLINPNIDMSKLSSMYMYTTQSPSLCFQIPDIHPRYFSEYQSARYPITTFQQAASMIDPVTIAVIKGACDVAVGTIPQIFPLVHDENTRKRLTRLDVLLQKVEDGSLLPEELNEAKKLHSRIHVHALMTQNAAILEYLEKGILLLVAQKCNTAEEQIDLIMLDEDCEEPPRTENLSARSSPRPSSIKSKASLPEGSRFISLDEQMRLFDTNTSMKDYMVPSEAALPACSSRFLTIASSVQDEEDGEDPIIGAIANAKRPKMHANLKKAACWSLVFTTGSIALLAPQVRRNLLSSKIKPQTATNEQSEADPETWSETSSMKKAFFSHGLDAALVAGKQHHTIIAVSEC